MNEMAKELVQFYQADEGFAGKEQFVICADDINLGLNHMQAYGDLQPDLGDVRDVVERIEGLQQLTGGLVVDGMLGRRTLRFMRSVPRCPNHPTNDFFDLLRLSSRGKEVLYFVHDLPNVTGGSALGILETAFEVWRAVSNSSIPVERVSRSEANVIISTGIERPDGEGGTLGEAHLGPPGDTARQLGVWLDNDETWVASSQYPGTLMSQVLTHELGHMLGLEHTNTRGQLMFPYYNAGVISPQAEDRQRIRQIWPA